MRDHTAAGELGQSLPCSGPQFAASETPPLGGQSGQSTCGRAPPAPLGGQVALTPPRSLQGTTNQTCIVWDEADA